MLQLVKHILRLARSFALDKLGTTRHGSSNLTSVFYLYQISPLFTFDKSQGWTRFSQVLVKIPGFTVSLRNSCWLLSYNGMTHFYHLILNKLTFMFMKYGIKNIQWIINIYMEQWTRGSDRISNAYSNHKTFDYTIRPRSSSSWIQKNKKETHSLFWQIKE